MSSRPDDATSRADRPSQTENDMTNQPHLPSDPSAHDDPTRAFDPGTTSQLPHLPQQAAPYRVEPSTPVPDDRVTPEQNPEARPWDGNEHHRPLVTVSKGPRPGTVAFGLISIIVAAYVILGNVNADIGLDLRQNLPAAIGAVGALLLLVGAVGVVASRRRR